MSNICLSDDEYSTVWLVNPQTGKLELYVRFVDAERKLQNLRDLADEYPDHSWEFISKHPQTVKQEVGLWLLKMREILT